MILRACVDACRSKPIISGQLDLWLQPELRFAAGMLHVYVRTDLVAREEVESVPTHPENRRAHRSRISDSCLRSTSGLTLILIRQTRISQQMRRALQDIKTPNSDHVEWNWLQP